MKGKLYNGATVKKKLDNLIKYISSLVVSFVKYKRYIESF